MLMANLRTHGGVHQHAAIEWVVFESLVVVSLAGLAIGYGFALWRARARSRWPIARTIMWYLGLACAGAGLVGPIASAAHTSFTVHMIGHLLLGMLAPLLMVLAAPITLALRALPVTAARRLTRVLRTPWVRLARRSALCESSRWSASRSIRRKPKIAGRARSQKGSMRNSFPRTSVKPVYT